MANDSEIVALGRPTHEWMYREFFGAYLINRQAGYTFTAEKCRQKCQQLVTLVNLPSEIVERLKRDGLRRHWISNSLLNRVSQ
jgi:hypothetical protein